ncbi:hypothetical protein HKX48_001056 [Thoreauomyces humboldtii]|nr:hypothetical protein HKX48_001056 [Thoreauomyces humboldtii]
MANDGQMFHISVDAGQDEELVQDADTVSIIPLQQQPSAPSIPMFMLDLLPDITTLGPTTPLLPRFKRPRPARKDTIPPVPAPPASQIATIVPGGNAAYGLDYSILLSPWQDARKKDGEAGDGTVVPASRTGVRSGAADSVSKHPWLQTLIRRRDGLVVAKPPDQRAVRRHGNKGDPRLRIVAHGTPVQGTLPLPQRLAEDPEDADSEGSGGRGGTPFLVPTWPDHYNMQNVGSLGITGSGAPCLTLPQLFRPVPDPTLPEDRPHTRDGRRWLVENLQAGSMESLEIPLADDEEATGSDDTAKRKWGLSLGMTPVVVRGTGKKKKKKPPRTPGDNQSQPYMARRSDRPATQATSSFALPVLAAHRPHTKHATVRSQAAFTTSLPSLASLPSMSSMPALPILDNPPPTVYLPTLTTHIRPHTRQSTPMTKKARALEVLMCPPKPPETRRVFGLSRSSSPIGSAPPPVTQPPRHLAKLLKAKAYGPGEPAFRKGHAMADPA